MNADRAACPDCGRTVNMSVTTAEGWVYVSGKLTCPACYKKRHRDTHDAPDQRTTMTEEMKQFDTGATRSSDDGKLDYEGFLSPLVLQRYAQYLNKHRVQADGKLRDSDNWQKGMPIARYIKSKFRHFMDMWMHHRGWEQRATEADIDDCICADLFNTMGYLHERLCKQYERELAAKGLGRADDRRAWENHIAGDLPNGGA